MVVESLFGAIKVLMMAISFKIIYMVLVSMFGQMGEYTTENGLIIKWKDKVLLLGVTGVNMLVSIKTTKSMEREHLNGQMVVNI
jgi:hypothetical protein